MIEEKASSIKLVFVDVDGVLTDGRITLNERGEEVKSFHVRDGLGLKMLRSAGIEVVIMTARKSAAVAHRAKELAIEDICQGVEDKGAACRQIRRKKGLKKMEVCSIGDDLPDLAMFMESGLRIAVADAVKEVREQADLVTKIAGGYGAVREACEWLLRCRGEWSTIGFTDQSRG